MRDQLHVMGDRARDRWGVVRMGNLDRQNMRLRDEVSHLRTRLEDERTETEDLKDALRAGPKVVKVKRRGGLFRVVVVGGAAYVMGTRDGRERYDQMKTWARSMRSRMKRKADDIATDIEASASPVSNGAEQATRGARPAGQMTARTGAESRTNATGTGP